MLPSGFSAPTVRIGGRVTEVSPGSVIVGGMERPVDGRREGGRELRSGLAVVAGGDHDRDPRVAQPAEHRAEGMVPLHVLGPLVVVPVEARRRRPAHSRRLRPALGAVEAREPSQRLDDVGLRGDARTSRPPARAG